MHEVVIFSIAALGKQLQYIEAQSPKDSGPSVAFPSNPEMNATNIKSQLHALPYNYISALFKTDSWMLTRNKKKLWNFGPWKPFSELSIWDEG